MSSKLKAALLALCAVVAVCFATGNPDIGLVLAGMAAAGELVRRACLSLRRHCSAPLSRPPS